ncbi:MAG: sxtJ, partial [Burkholderiales bacterium]|nr:sxtJ [Burkholderiales bacterium]
PTPKELRRFGLVLALTVIAVFVGLLPWLFGHGMPRWPWPVAAALSALAAFGPRLLAPVHRGWMVIGHALGWVNSRIVLTAIFFLMIMPIGLVLRLFGKNPIAREPDADATSYRIASTDNHGKRMERPF